MKKWYIGLGALALLAGGYVWWNTPHENPPVVVASAPIEVITPEVLKALNAKIGALAVTVPLETETVTPPAREREVFLFGTFTYSNGSYLAGGKMDVGFEGTRITRTGENQVEVVLGSPVTRALDDTFTTVVQPEDSYLSDIPPDLFETARAQGRKQLLERACSSGKYDMASAAGVLMVIELFRKASPAAVVTVKTTPATCA